MNQLVETVRMGPYGIFFTNRNKVMALPGHSHYAEVMLTFLSMAPTIDGEAQGFPSFAPTAEALQVRLQTLTARPIDGTNEHLVRLLFAAFDGWTHETMLPWGGHWCLLRVTLDVQGVRDGIGHAPGMTRYEVQRTAAQTSSLYWTRQQEAAHALGTE